MKMSKEHWAIDADRVKLTYSGEKPAQVHFCAPEISRGLSCVETRVS